MKIEILGKDANQIQNVMVHKLAPGIAQLTVITRDKWIGLVETSSWLKKEEFVFNQIVPTFCLRARHVPEEFEDDVYETEVVLTPENLEELELVTGLTFELQDKDTPMFLLVSRAALKAKKLLTTYPKNT